MNPGYFSETAVKDLLAVKTGEIEYLKKVIEQLQVDNNSLQEQLIASRCSKCACS